MAETNTKADQELLKRLGAALREQREYLGLSVREIPGVNKSFISRAERGIWPPAMMKLIAMAKALHVTPVWVAAVTMDRKRGA